MPKDYISREDAISCVKHAWAKGLEPTQYLEELDAIDAACEYFEDKDCDSEQLCACLGIVRKRLKKLKEYEDTGLSPEEVGALFHRVKRDNVVIPDVTLFGKSLEHWDELNKAEAEDRLAVLPCKVGDTVYWIRGKAILEVFIQWFETNAYGWCACGMYPPLSTPTFRFADFGKTVFLTREEAEKALERSKNNDKP